MITKSGETAPPLSAFPKDVQEAVMAIWLKGAERMLAEEAKKKKASNE